MIVNELGAFVATLRYEDLPAEIVSAVKIRLLDVLAGALTGYSFGNHASLLTILPDGDEAVVWGNGRRLSLRDAILVNTFLAHSTYMEDGSRFTGGHPSSALIPAAVSIAALTNASGRDLLTAIVAGYEIFLRMGTAIFPSTVVRGFQSTAVLASSASAAVGAHLLRLSAAQATHALAISCSLGVGLKEALKCSSSQPLQVGRSSEGGVFAAQFARGGALGADSIIEHGFLKAFAEGTVGLHILEGLGTTFNTRNTYMKLHGGCRGTHAPVDVVTALVRREGLNPADIKMGTVYVGTVTFAGDIHAPRNPDQAQFCAAFCIAVVLLQGHISVFDFTKEKLEDPAVRALMAKFSVRADTELDKHFPAERGARAEIELLDGRRLIHTIAHARGEPECPLTAAEVEEKFMLHVERILGPGAQRVRDLVMAMETIGDVNELVVQLRAPA